MSALVEAIQAERRALIEPLLAPIADKLRTLEEMERLALSLNGGGSDVATIAPPKPAAKPPKPTRRVVPPSAPSTRVGRDGLGERAQDVLGVIRALGSWVTIGEVARAVTSTSPNAVKGHMQKLVARGLVEAQGQTTQRRYRAVVDDKAWSGEEQRALPTPAADSSEVAEPEPPPRRSVPDLTAGERRIARARILDHCSRRRLDEQSLSTTLNVRREVIADICGQLLLDDKIVLHPDGRYEVPA